MSAIPYASSWTDILGSLSDEQKNALKTDYTGDYINWMLSHNQAPQGEGSTYVDPNLRDKYGLTQQELEVLSSFGSGSDVIPLEYVKQHEAEFKALDPSFKIEGIETFDHPLFGEVVNRSSIPSQKDGGWADVLAAAIKIGGFATGISGLANVATGAGNFFGPGNFATDLFSQISNAFGGDGGLLTSGAEDAVLNGGELTDILQQAGLSPEQIAEEMAKLGIADTSAGAATELTLQQLIDELASLKIIPPGIGSVLDILPGYDADGNWTGTNADGTSIFDSLYGTEGIPNTIPWDGSFGTSLTDALKKAFTDSAGNWDWSKLSLAGLGGAGLLGSLLDNDPQTSTSTATMTPNLPDWYTNAAKDVLAKAQGMEYSPYTGNLNVGASPNQIAAANLASSSVGKYDSLLKEAQTAAKAGGKSILDMDLEKYMSPYWMNALNPQINKINQDRAITSNQIAADMAKKSMFGTSRFEVAKALSDQEFNRRIDDIMATGAQKAWDAGTGMATGDRSAQATLGQNLAGLATTGSALTGQDISRLGTTGQTMYDIDVGNVTRDYQNWLASQTLPLQYQNALTGTLTAVKPQAGVTTTTTQTGAAQSPWQTLLGTGSMLWGLANPKGLA